MPQTIQEPNLRRINRERQAQRGYGTFSAWMKDKKVVFIGPAGYYMEPEELPHDVIARCNHSYTLGRRTDILYVNAFIGRRNYMEEIVEMAGDIGLQWLVTKDFNAAERVRGLTQDFQVLSIRHYLTTVINRKMNHANRGGETGLNMGLIAIEHLLNANIKRLDVRGVDFYESSYYPGYSFREEINVGRHDQDMHKNYFRQHIYPDERVHLDSNMRKILGVRPRRGDMQ